MGYLRENDWKELTMSGKNVGLDSGAEASNWFQMLQSEPIRRTWNSSTRQCLWQKKSVISSPYVVKQLIFHLQL